MVYSKYMFFDCIKGLKEAWKTEFFSGMIKSPQVQDA